MIGWRFLLELRNGKAGSFPYFVILFPRMNPGVKLILKKYCGKIKIIYEEGQFACLKKEGTNGA
jgi:hypothetical protein